MKPKILLRIASIIMLLHTLGHTMGALTWKDAPNAAVKQVIDGMLGNRFDFMGWSVSMGDFFAGYGYGMIGVLLLISILLWLLSAEPNRRFILALGLFLLFLSIIEFIYFFPFAAAFSFVAGIATLLGMSGGVRKSNI
ncbi:LIC_13387 family protein [Mucilaginibacter ginsenosidivorans]|uniref:Uncharacterized protein n=1 Tax=Mucilaginibacter ginsenosidivorans TaxID=398053 RepID=A0A5B8V1V3_9SPHI|nr:hypothetical protein [Mucilaginibacter ginsenosidivorans]QEC65232.1 hypothetical protein FRZ54_22545 [Mucilaginibacter ginsenosidivorans]